MVAAFISYAHRYQPWVGVFQRNLEAGLRHLGRPGTVFLDEVDLGSGRSWLGQLQAGLNDADAFVLVATPEALASRYVADELEAFLAGPADWRGRLHVALLVDTPVPPLLRVPQWVDFSEHDEARYRSALRTLLGRLRDHLVPARYQLHQSLHESVASRASVLRRSSPDQLGDRVAAWPAPTHAVSVTRCAGFGT